jgi:hypothetical protein
MLSHVSVLMVCAASAALAARFYVSTLKTPMLVRAGGAMPRSRVAPRDGSAT